MIQIIQEQIPLDIAEHPSALSTEYRQLPTTTSTPSFHPPDLDAPDSSTPTTMPSDGALPLPFSSAGGGSPGGVSLTPRHDNQQEKARVLSAQRLTRLRGVELLRDPFLNKGMAFTERERDLLGLRGLLPPQVSTIEQQLTRLKKLFDEAPSDIARWEFFPRRGQDVRDGRSSAGARDPLVIEKMIWVPHFQNFTGCCVVGEFGNAKG